MVEGLDAQSSSLPSGVAVARSVTMTGTRGIPVQVANFGLQDVYLQPRVPIATLTEVELVTPDVTTVNVGCNEIRFEEASGVARQTTTTEAKRTRFEGQL